MNSQSFKNRVIEKIGNYESFVKQNNSIKLPSNGIFERYNNPVLTAAHVPLVWRIDFNENSNPYLMERLGVNAVFNAGAILWNGKFLLAARIEGYDRKSFFAFAESETGKDNFRFIGKPLQFPESENPATNVYDMRLTAHEDGYVYGVFCVERKDLDQPDDLSAAIAQCGIIRSKDLKNWERLPDLKTKAPQQRNCVLHPEFVDGKYAFYTRPLNTFMATGTGEGIGWGLCDNILNPVIKHEEIIDKRVYHTIKEGKIGMGPAPIKTSKGWLHLAHAVRENAAGMRYVLYSFLTSLDNPCKIIAQPGGYLMAPEGEERIGDVSDVLFTNGWVAKENGDLFIYYASSDTRLHVATTTVDRLLDYVTNTPEDALRSSECVKQRISLIDRNQIALRDLVI
jgi:4-O-beta-D-mannosyl-D-glucose phosphorylase